MLKVSLFGDFRAAWDGVAVDRLPRRLVGDLWVYVLLHRDVPMPVGQLAAVFWPDVPEATARGNLRRYLHFLIQSLPPAGAGPAWMLRDRNTVQWNPAAPIELDVAIFESLLRRARVLADDGDLASARADLVQADELYGADLLPASTADWLGSPREQLKAQRAAGLDLWARIDAIEGRNEDALATALRLHALVPERDSGLALVVWLLATLGRREEALERLAIHRAGLAGGSGLAPSPELATLREAVAEGASLAAWHPGALLRPELGRPAPEIGGAGARRASGNLPAPADAFVGRTEALAAIARLLSISRLVTLTGVGGTGKSRLALERARARGEAFGDGVYWVDLTAISDPRLVDRAVAVMLGRKPVPGKPVIDGVVEHVRHKTLLIILDNCEHLLEASAAVAARLLEAGPGVHLLATSRVKLDVPGEVVWSVPALAVPVDDPLLSIDMLEDSEAVQLFLARVRGVWPEFAADLARLRAIAGICRQVDGIPLAIELAAARVSVLDVEAIAERLATSFAVLARADREHPDRHRTLAAAIDWGYQLLTPAEQAVVRRLSVFAGGFTLPSAQAVCADLEDHSHDSLAGADIYDLVGRLIDKSFIAPDLRTTHGRRYRMLEMIRHFGGERLLASGEAAEITRRHARCFLAMVERVEPHLKRPGFETWLDELEQEQPNLRAAMEWMQAAQAWPWAHRFCAAAWRYWHLRGYIDPEREWAEQVLAQPAPELPATVDANARYGAGVLAYVQGDYAAARDHWMTGIALWRELGELKSVAVLINNLGLLAMVQGDFAAAQPYAQEALDLSRRIGEPAGIAKALSALADLAKRRGDYPEAYQRFRDSLAALDGVEGVEFERAGVLRGLGSLTLAQGEYVESERYLQEWLAFSRAVRHKADIAAALSLLGMLATETGHYDEAADQLRESLALWRELGHEASVARTFHNLGELELRRGRTAIARTFLDRSLAMKRQLGDEWNAAYTLIALADLHCLQGDPDAARALVAEGLDAARHFGAKSLIARAQGIQARIEIAAGRPERAAEPLRECLALAREMGEQRSIAVGLDIAAALATAQEDLTAAARLAGEADAIRARIRAPRTGGEAAELARWLAAP